MIIIGLSFSERLLFLSLLVSLTLRLGKNDRRTNPFRSATTSAHVFSINAKKRDVISQTFMVQVGAGLPTPHTRKKELFGLLMRCSSFEGGEGWNDLEKFDMGSQVELRE